MESLKKVDLGSQVIIKFCMTFPDGQIIEASGDEPVTITIGAAEIEKNLENTLLGLTKGDKLEKVLSPEEAFGLHNPFNFHWVNRSIFPEDWQLEPNQIIHFDYENQNIAGRVIAVEDHQVCIDGNHPLAGHTLNWQAEIIDIL